MNDLKPTSDQRPVARHRGPSLLIVAIVYAILTSAGVVAPMVIAGGQHFPSPFASNPSHWFVEHPYAALLSAFLCFGSAIPLGIYTATVSSRLRFLGMPVAGIDIALFGGAAASIILATSACAQWVLAQPVVAGGSALPILHLFSFATGGPGFAVPFGLLLAGVSVVGGVQRLIPRWLMAAGLAIAVIAELSVFTFVWTPMVISLPIARFGGLLWMIGAGALLPQARAARSRSEES